MPQDIPLEARDTKRFTPDCLAGLPSPPVFMLRAATTREKFHQRYLLRENGAEQHSSDAMREEMLNGLRAMWGAEVYDRDSAVLQDYWQALDEFAAARRKDPDLTFDYDEDVVARVAELEREVARAHRRYGTMRADNAFAAEVQALSTVAVVIESFTGLTATAERSRGYYGIDAADEIRSALLALEREHKIAAGQSWAELLVACTLRMFLTADEEKNFESRSQSKTDRKSSKTPALSEPSPGSSPALSPTKARKKPSTKTPQSA